MNHPSPSRRGFLRAAGTAALLPALSARTGAARSPPGIAWSETYGGRGEQMFADAAPAHDDGWILVGVDRGTDATRTRPWIVSVAPDGTRRWERRPESGPDELASVVRTDDGYAAAGEGGWFVTLDATGEVRSATDFVDEDPVRRTRVVEIDAGFVIGGIEPTPETSSTLLVGVDPDGTERWRRSYRTEYDLSILTPWDGGVVAGGWYLEEGGPWFASVAPDGTERWKTVLSLPDWPGPADAVPVGDGITVVGDNGLFHLNADREVAWKRKYDALSDTHPDVLVRTSDGGYVFAGLKEETLLVRVSKVDADGGLQWSGVYGNGDAATRVTPAYELGTIIERVPGEYLLVGGRRTGAWNGWVASLSEGVEPSRVSETPTAVTDRATETPTTTAPDGQTGFGVLAALLGLVGGGALYTRRRE